MGSGKQLGATISVSEPSVNCNDIAMNSLDEKETCLRLYPVPGEEIPSDVDDRDIGPPDEWVRRHPEMFVSLAFIHSTLSRLYLSS